MITNMMKTSIFTLLVSIPGHSVVVADLTVATAGLRQGMDISTDANQGDRDGDIWEALKVLREETKELKLQTKELKLETKELKLKNNALEYELEELKKNMTEQPPQALNSGYNSGIPYVVTGDVEITGSLTVGGVISGKQISGGSLSVSGNSKMSGDILISGANVMVQNDLVVNGGNLWVKNGVGSTDSANGKGNLIIGYNNGESKSGTHERTGSHNVIIGDEHEYTSYGGIVAGYQNEISAPWASVTGGKHNAASEEFSSVSGGLGNKASGSYSSVSGGYVNTASGNGSSVIGGRDNVASGTYSIAPSGSLQYDGRMMTLPSQGGLENKARGGPYLFHKGGGNDDDDNMATGDVIDNE